MAGGGVIRVSDWTTSTAPTAGGGGHTHTGVTNGMNANDPHNHSVTVNSYSGSSGASSAANTGNTGSGTAFSNMPPFTAVTYIIKT
jgi:hypothetical protein